MNGRSSAGSPDDGADAVGPHLHDLKCWLAGFEWRVLQTARARIQTAKRLERRGYAWTAALVGLVVLTLLGSIVDLAFASSTPELDQVVLIVLSVVALSGSLVVANREYGERAARVSSNYRHLQSLSAQIEVHRTRGHGVDLNQVREWMQQYDALLEAAENHTSADYQVARRLAPELRPKCICDVGSSSESSSGPRQFERLLSLLVSNLPWVVLTGSYICAFWYVLTRTPA